MKYLWIIIIALILAGCGGNNDKNASNESIPALWNAESAPAVKAPNFSLTNMNGETVALSDFSDKPVLLVFWATWCPHCKAEIPKLKEIHAENNDEEFKILALSVDDNADKLKDFTDENGIVYTVLYDEGTEIAKSYEVVGIPAHFVVDSDGNRFFYGPNIDNALGKIESLLNAM